MGPRGIRQINSRASGKPDYLVYNFRLGPPSETGSLSMRLFATVFLMMLSAIPPAFAYECADQTQPGLNSCAEANYEKADVALNRAYKEIIRRLKDDAATAKLLVTAQKAWIAYRDAECAFSASANAGGTIYPMVMAICLEAVTKERTRALGVFLKCGDGDTGCPAPAP
jgi:uncharacterized protein YecT (DUF1311 family)